MKKCKKYCNLCPGKAFSKNCCISQEFQQQNTPNVVISLNHYILLLFIDNFNGIERYPELRGNFPPTCIDDSGNPMPQCPNATLLKCECGKCANGKFCESERDCPYMNADTESWIGK